MSERRANQLFENYTKIAPSIAPGLWMALRLITLGLALALAAGLILAPGVGLKLFWGLSIPVLPMILVVAPGFWRQICPMALLNQIPRMTNLSAARDLPESARNWAFAIAIASFFGLVALRQPLLNQSGILVGFGVLGVLTLAFIGGLVFKGRSGWCGTFCPLGPIQRNYGQAPLVMVRNGYCETCLGCQKNCYDFNPRAAVFSDIYDEDPRYSGQRRFFMAMMPGMILGYFLQPAAIAYGEPMRAVILVASTCASVGLYQMATSFLGLNAFRAANAFAGLALVAFYTFAIPTVFKTLMILPGLDNSVLMNILGLGVGVALAAIVYFQGRKNETIFEQATNAGDHLHIDLNSPALKARLAGTGGAKVKDRNTQKSFQMAADQTLLEAIEDARIKINFGCRSGMCGADAVLICEGNENLTPASDDELTTLRRLGLEGVARLACVCRATGEVTIDTNIKNLDHSESLTKQPKASSEDPLQNSEVRKVVIVGNGVGGTSVADALRRTSASVEITMVSDEPHHFYNRMAIGRVIYGRAAMDGLFLLPDDWYAKNGVEVWRNTIVRSIDPASKVVHLGTGEQVEYDKLVLATGADAQSPSAAFEQFPNAFVLRKASDAQAIRHWAQFHVARNVVVIGGGVLGVEAADALHHLGLHVKLLQRSSRLMDRQLDVIGAQRLTSYLTNIGIEVITEAAVTGFEGTAKLEAIALNNGDRLNADLFVACAGVAPRLNLAKAAGLETGRGIIVDRNMRTSDPDIYSVGDAAELKGTIGGLWPVAAAQAEVAASDILKRPKPFDAPPIMLQLKCDGIDLRSFGEITATEGDEIISSSPDETAWWSVLIRENQLIGAVFVGPPGSSRGFTRTLQSGVAIVDELRAGHFGSLTG